MQAPPNKQVPLNKLLLQCQMYRIKQTVDVYMSNEIKIFCYYRQRKMSKHASSPENIQNSDNKANKFGEQQQSRIHDTQMNTKSNQFCSS